MVERIIMRSEGEEADETRRQRMTDIIRGPVRKELETKYPAAAEIADYIVKLGALGEQFAELTKNRNEKQDSAGPEYDQAKEKEISDLNKKIGIVISEEDEIRQEINKVWKRNRIDSKKQEKYPGLQEWETELRKIVGDNWDLAKVIEKSKN
ncbi:MAG TPA: hypothetical protein VJH63_03180 [Candidatus Paceibacterota bacterium]